MTEAIDIFASYWIYFMFISLGLAFIGLGYLFYWQYGKPANPKKILKIGVLLFLQVLLTWIIGFGSLGIIQSNARSEFKSLLEEESLKLTINGHRLINEEKREFIEVLKSIRRTPAHHSSPTKEIKIELKNNSKITTIYLNRDSRIENEYWVFWDKYEITKNNEIGRIINEKIKKYRN